MGIGVRMGVCVCMWVCMCLCVYVFMCAFASMNAFFFFFSMYFGAYDRMYSYVCTHAEDTSSVCNIQTLALPAHRVNDVRQQVLLICQLLLDADMYLDTRTYEQVLDEVV